MPVLSCRCSPPRLAGPESLRRLLRVASLTLSLVNCHQLPASFTASFCPRQRLASRVNSGIIPTAVLYSPAAPCAAALPTAIRPRPIVRSIVFRWLGTTASSPSLGPSCSPRTRKAGVRCNPEPNIPCLGRGGNRRARNQKKMENSCAPLGRPAVHQSHSRRVEKRASWVTTSPSHRSIPLRDGSDYCFIPE